MKRMSKKWIYLVLIGGFTAVAVLYWSGPLTAKVESAEIEGGIQLKFKTSGSHIEVYSNQTWNPYFAKGVNMGATIPGHFPGELAISKKDYMRWFGMIQEMGANVIRVYTILQPEFYEALVTYNAKRKEDPLFFIQGVWSPEEELIEGRDAFEPEVKQKFIREIQDAVDAVYGTAKIDTGEHGKAHGTYLFNAGPYLMGWIIGTEWDPKMVEYTNNKYADIPNYEGEHFRSKPESNAFEKWLAEMVDITAQSERKHGWQHPIAFSNWVTTDPLEHPGEPLFEEDLVSVDPLHLEVKDWAAGYFASYHVYPYYPDFFSFDKTFQTMKNDRGEIDSYKSYLHQLKKYHRELPMMITEFGVPASQGVAHLGRLGRNQGGHSEKQQGEINSDMFRQIHEEGYSGAILFTWQDEWFKKTWNTQLYDDPDRRAYWYNTMTNESFFGVLGMFPSKDDVIFIDGDSSDWDRLNKKEKQKLDMEINGFDEIEMTHDEGYLYLKIQLTEPFLPSKQTLYLGVDTLKGGNRHAEELQDVILDEGLETLIELSDEEKGEVRIASNYDMHTRLYNEAGMTQVDPKSFQDNSGIFHPWKLVVNYRLEYPDSRIDYPFGDIEVGELLRGYSDPSHPEYHSKTMWQFEDQLIELRIPWMLLGFSDPSSLSVIDYGDVIDGKFETSIVEGVRIIPWIVHKDTKRVVGLEGKNPYPVSQTPLYTWNGWEEDDVEYVERPKQSYYIMQQVMRKVNSPVKYRNESM